MSKCPKCKSILEEVAFMGSEKTFFVCNECDMSYEISEVD